MGEYKPDRPVPDQSARKSSSGIPAWLFAVLVIALLTLLGMGEFYVYAGAANAFRAICPLLGLYVSVRLILDGSYGALGF